MQSEYDRRFVRTESLLTARLLQALHGYGSGNERLFELSESCRSTVVYHAKYMGLFQDPEPHPPASGSLEDTWKEWIRQEKRRRLGWAVYVSPAGTNFDANIHAYPLFTLAGAKLD